MKRAILIVMDSLGVGEAPDASDFDNVGANTFGHIYREMKNINIPNLRKLGFCNIDGMPKELAVDKPIGAYGKAKEHSKGKDTITGHFEMAGIFTDTPFNTYPDGFPKEFISAFEERIGTGVIGNYAESGTVIIEKLGDEHEKTGKPIVYTSNDSVFQIAANINVIPLEKLYEICKIARELLVGEWACGRVIARPYDIIDGKRERTEDRHDYAVSPSGETLLDKVHKGPGMVYAVGKIKDIFNGCGVDYSIHSGNNNNGINDTISGIKGEFEGLLFTNLVDFDSLYGHRRDPIGYGKAIEEFDSRLPEILENMKDDDILILTADHGNDPTYKGYDHTRELIPIVVYGKNIKSGYKLELQNTFANIGATIAEYLGTEKLKHGESFLEEIINKIEK